MSNVDANGTSNTFNDNVSLPVKREYLDFASSLSTTSLENGTNGDTNGHQHYITPPPHPLREHTWNFLYAYGALNNVVILAEQASGRTSRSAYGTPTIGWFIFNYSFNSWLIVANICLYLCPSISSSQKTHAMAIMYQSTTARQQENQASPYRSLPSLFLLC
jgi:hypothetical protein